MAENMIKKVNTKDKGKARVSTQALNIAGITQLGRMLIEVGNKYPRAFVNEKDYYPLVEAYLYLRAPKVKTEVHAETGRIDFRIGGSNPVNIELVVTHRNLVDQDGPNIPSPKRTELYASGNVKELSKLSALAPSKSRVNFLLLIDTQGDKAYDPVKLKQKYRERENELGPYVVRVVYVNRTEDINFLISGSKAPRKLKGAKKS